MSVAVTDPRPFAITDPLPTGTVLLEASAGTGKTWTIGALVTRYVVEGVARLEQMLVVTFGRAASQELRERVRAQLVEAERVLSDDAADRASVPGSELVDLLLTYDDEQRRLAHRRVVEALVGFDAATIATTHQFCSMVLDSLGVAGDSDSRARLVEDLDDLVREVVDDLYLRAFALDEGGPAFTYDEALTIARRVVDDPQAHLEPEARTARARPAAGCRSRTRCAPRWTAASGGSASSPTTTCSASSPTRSPPRSRRRPSGCGSGGRSCWSTSSRTPTRCSGRCSTGPSAATPRWC
jgi:superfamily I DNA/RNA helicase